MSLQEKLKQLANADASALKAAAGSSDIHKFEDPEVFAMEILSIAEVASQFSETSQWKIACQITDKDGNKKPGTIFAPNALRRQLEEKGAQNGDLFLVRYFGLQRTTKGNRAHSFYVEKMEEDVDPA